MKRIIIASTALALCAVIAVSAFFVLRKDVAQPHYVPHRDDPHYNSSADNTMSVDMPRTWVGNCGPGDYGLIYGFQVLAGEDVYYTLGSFTSSPIGWSAADVTSIYRRDVNASKDDEVICEHFEEAVISGLMDTGEDLLIWSNWRENSDFKVWRMSYDGKKTSLILNQPLEIQVLDAILVKDCLWYAGYTFDYEAMTARSEIYEMRLDQLEPKCIYSSDSVISELLYANEKLFFIEAEQALKALNPGSGEVRTLAANENPVELSEEYEWFLNNALIDGYETRRQLIALNGRIYFWCDWNGAVMSVDMNGNDLKRVMDRGKIYFRQIFDDGVSFEASYEKDALNQYFCPYNDPANPAFDPENSQWESWDYERYILEY